MTQRAGMLPVVHRVLGERVIFGDGHRQARLSSQMRTVVDWGMSLCVVVTLDGVDNCLDEGSGWKKRRYVNDLIIRCYLLEISATSFSPRRLIPFKALWLRIRYDYQRIISAPSRPVSQCPE